ncbi:hypothetical protein MKX03_033585 [Papaver bracteatum]|nr:hypothetical protein MKX03_033585 [Papaver bracteatum]
MSKLALFFGFSVSVSKTPAPYFELLNAAYHGNLKRFKRLALNHVKGEGIGVTEAIGKVKLKDGRGCLHYASEKGNLEVCKYLLENLKLDVNSKDGNGRTPLYQAIFKGHFVTVRYLLEKGADPDESDILDATPLICAIKSGDIKIITLLLSRGVRVDFATRFGTSLSYAISRGHQNAVKVLLDHGTNPNGVDNQGMLTPLISAIAYKSLECMKLLLKKVCKSGSFGFG